PGAPGAAQLSGRAARDGGADRRSGGARQHGPQALRRPARPVPRAPAQRLTGISDTSPHSGRHGVIRGIQRGTPARNASYSLPNVRSSVGSSYATTKTWKKSQSSAP